MAWGTWELGLLKANLDVLIFMLGDPGLCALVSGLCSDFTRQLGELKARPVVLTPFWKGDLGVCSCGLGLSGASDIVVS